MSGRIGLTPNMPKNFDAHLRKLCGFAFAPMSRLAVISAAESIPALFWASRHGTIKDLCAHLR